MNRKAFSGNNSTPIKASAICCANIWNSWVSLYFVSMSRGWYFVRIAHINRPLVRSAPPWSRSISPLIPQLLPRFVMRMWKAFLGLLREVGGRSHRRFCSCRSSQRGSRCSRINKNRDLHTESSHPHLPVLVRWKHRPGPPSLSAGEVSDENRVPCADFVAEHTCFALRSSSIPISRWWRRLNLLILSWSSLRTSTSSPAAFASSSLESCKQY